MDESLPLLSIITPCYNRAGLITSAIESTLDQDYPHVEHIIVDGGSTDGTLDVLRRYPHLRVISESDRGMYDALNKGVRLARGQVIGFLNTDDCYEPQIFGSVMQTMLDDPNLGAVVGGATFFREPSGQPPGTQKIIASFSPVAPQELYYRLTRGVSIFNAWFFRRNVFDLAGEFDIRYRASADRDFLIRLAIRGLPYACLGQTVYHYRQHSASMTISDGGNAETHFVFEDLTVAETYLQPGRSDVPPEAQRYLRLWHSQITANQALLALSRFNISAMGRYAGRGNRYNLPGWGLIFINSLVHSMFRRVRQAIRHLSSSTS